MFIVGKVKTVVDRETVAWDVVEVAHTERRAKKACVDEKHFYFRAWYGQRHENGPTIFPKAVK